MPSPTKIHEMSKTPDDPVAVNTNLETVLQNFVAWNRDFEGLILAV